MPKITFIGGGSAKFVAELVKDVFTYPALRGSHICLMDVDAARLAPAKRVVQRIIAELAIPATVETTLDQREAVRDADYVVVTVMVGGMEHYRSDGEIPIRYGVLPSVGDTIGPGGVFRLVRTAPVLRELARNLREVAPKAWVLNYANPMAMNTWTLRAAGIERVVGLCHSIQYMYTEIARWLGIPPGEVRYTAGGINHVDFYLTLEHRGRDLYPDLLAAEDRVLAAHPDEIVRFELLRHLGYWPAEGTQHQSEYTPWFRKDQATADRYASETMWGYRIDSSGNEIMRRRIDEQIAGTRPICYERGNEYGSGIINSLETGEPGFFYGNVTNDDLIENLPRGALVEVPCHVDGNGILPCRVGRIPTQLAAVMTPHIHVHELALRGVTERSRRLIRQAIQADPLTAAIGTLPRIAAMVDELFAANAAWVADWPEERRPSPAVAAAGAAG